MATDNTELRGLAPVDLVQALDALAHAELMDRTAYINKILDAHVKEVCHKQIVISRMLRGNTYLSDASGMVG